MTIHRVRDGRSACGHGQIGGTGRECRRAECYAPVNPLVCVCLEPQADRSVNYGECRVCRRPPLALFRILREGVTS